MHYIIALKFTTINEKTLRLQMNKIIIAFILLIFCKFTFASELTEFFQLAKTKDCSKVSSFIGESSDPDYFRAISYELEICNEKDRLKALKYYRNSALSGNTESMYSFFVTVGQLATVNEQTDELMNEAKVWIVKAADNKHHGAAVALSTFHKIGGFGFQKDERKSLYYESISKLTSPSQ